MMMVLSLVSMALGFYLVSKLQFNPTSQAMVWVGLGCEIFPSFVVASIGYSILGAGWEGYYGRRFLQIFHIIALSLFSTIVPHGDFLLHMGYRQRGYLEKGNGAEELFPDGFELPKDYMDY